MISVPPSSRLRYRLLTADDEEILWHLDQDPLVMKYITRGKVTSKEAMKQTILPRMAKYHNPSKGWGLWGAFQRESSEFIGWVLVRPMNFFETPEYDNLELGWRFCQSSWGKGLATEAASSVLTALKSADASLCYSAIADPENTASINIMKKLGMVFIDQRDVKFPDGVYRVDYYSTP
jgi:RimJ/RimL family protein N-acetyltransferase